jgi:hypothetical protein
VFQNLSNGEIMQLVKTLGRASLYRKESYNHRTTPIIEWVVRVGDKTMRQCYTKRDAMAWLNIYKD